jgi:hypothetical protein
MLPIKFLPGFCSSRLILYSPIFARHLLHMFQKYSTVGQSNTR